MTDCAAIAAYAATVRSALASSARPVERAA